MVVGVSSLAMRLEDMKPGQSRRRAAYTDYGQVAFLEKKQFDKLERVKLSPLPRD